MLVDFYELSGVGEFDLEMLDLVIVFGGLDAECFQLGYMVEVMNLGFHIEAEFVGGGLLHKELVRGKAYDVGKIHKCADVDLVSFSGKEAVNSFLGGMKL